MKKLTHLLLILVSLSAYSFANDDLAPLVAHAERLLYTGDDAAHALLEEKLSALAQTSPDDDRVRYLRGLHAFAHTALSYRAKNTKAVQADLEKAEALLATVQRKPWEAEAKALRGAIAGQLIGIKGGMSGMRLGPKSQELTEEAFRAAPNSPRVLVCRGLILLNAPEMFGGNPKEGARLIARAVSLFETGTHDAAILSWGRAYALAWSAQAKLLSKDLPAAKAAADQALALEPNYGWVRYNLLPAIDRAHASHTK